MLRRVPAVTADVTERPWTGRASRTLDGRSGSGLTRDPPRRIFRSGVPNERAAQADIAAGNAGSGAPPPGDHQAAGPDEALAGGRAPDARLRGRSDPLEGVPTKHPPTPPSKRAPSCTRGLTEGRADWM